jgi:hypothetical protein
MLSVVMLIVMAPKKFYMTPDPGKDPESGQSGQERRKTLRSEAGEKDLHFGGLPGLIKKY